MTTYTWQADNYLENDTLEDAGFTRISTTNLSSPDTGIIAKTTPLGLLALRAYRADAGAYFMFSWSGTESMPASSNGEVLALVLREDNLPAASANQRSSAGVIFRAQTGNNHGYLTRTEGQNSPANTAFNRGTATTNYTAVGCHTPTSNGLTDQYDWYWVRTRFDGANTKTRFWNYGETEPTEWVIDCDDVDADTYTTAGRVGFGGRFDYNADAADSTASYLAYLSASDDPLVAAPFPTTATPGITITGIKEPNEADTLVTGVTNARVKVWYGTDDTGAEDELHTAQSITAGELSVELTGGTVDGAAVVEALWIDGTERKLVVIDTTIVDLGAS